MSTVLAVVPVRGGTLPAGGAEVVAEAAGRALLVGSGTDAAAAALVGVSTEVRAWECGDFAPARWAATLAPVLSDEATVLLPGSPDGRDLAPRLAALLERPLHAAVMELSPHTVTSIGMGGRVLVDRPRPPASVAWLQPGVRGVVADRSDAPEVVRLELDELRDAPGDAHVEQVLPPDVATMDLSEAPRLLGGGAGLDGPARFEQLSAVAAALDAATGATRVVTDRGWLGHDRQIGTTGVVVDPRLYLAFGVSGAVQHTAGLGDPDHVISVNLDQHCPMMDLADLAVVADANATLDELAERLGVGEGDARPGGSSQGPVPQADGVGHG